MNVIVEGFLRGVVREDTKGSPPKERHYISVEQKRKDGTPDIGRVTSYMGVDGMKEGDRVSLKCFSSLNTWEDKFGKFHARVDFILQELPGSGKKA